MMRTAPLMIGLASLAGVAACGSGPSDPSAPSGPFVIAADSSQGAGFGAASDGSSFVVAYSVMGQRDHPDVVALRVSESGETIDPAPVAISDAQSDPFLLPETAEYTGAAVAYDGAQYGVSFLGFGDTETCSACGEEVAFVPVATSGNTLAKPTLIDSVTSFSMSASSLRLPVPVSGADDKFTLLYVTAEGGITGSFSTIDGANLAYGNGAITSQAIENLVPDAGYSDQSVTTAWAPSVGVGGSGALGAWLESRSPLGPGAAETYLEGAWLTPDGGVSRVELASLGANASFGQPSPNIPDSGTAVATNGEDFLVVWGTKPNSDNLPTELRGLRYQPATGPVDPDGGFIIAGGSSGKRLGGAAMKGGRALVVWGEDGSVRGAYIEQDGSPDAPFVIDEGPADASTSIASNGENFLVVYAHPEVGNKSSIRGQLLD